MTNKQKKVLPFYESQGWKFVKCCEEYSILVMVIERKIAQSVYDPGSHKWKSEYEEAYIGPNGEFSPPRGEYTGDNPTI